MKKKIPVYISIACDLYISDKIDINQIAKKYNKTIQQIRWILGKSIKNNLPEMWKYINAKLHNKPLPKQMQYINVMANMHINNWDFPKATHYLHKTDKQIYDALRYMKNKFPVTQNLFKF